MENEQAIQIIETLLYMTDHPLTEKEISEVIGLKSITEAEIKSWIQEISSKLQQANSPLQIVEVAGGVQMATKTEMAPWIRKLYKERLTVRLSPSALETLSIIAYKQPIARSEVEQIRGVEATGVMETLVERRLVKVVGRKETIGRPLLYGTSQEFLRQFGLKHLTDLPDLATIPTPSLSTSGSETDSNSSVIESTPPEEELVAVGSMVDEELPPSSPSESEPVPE